MADQRVPAELTISVGPSFLASRRSTGWRAAEIRVLAARPFALRAFTRLLS
jgi:hypothetical protein